jgi:peptidoglycan/xylan/chitin deacetylase (PgdA/CDA1 family)
MKKLAPQAFAFDQKLPGRYEPMNDTIITAALFGSGGGCQRFFRTRMVLGVLLAMGALSCAPMGEFLSASQRHAYRSDDYVIYPLRGAESTADLAQEFLQDRSKAWIIEDANPGNRFQGGDYVVIPLREDHRGGLSADGFQTVPILTYHRFAETCSSPLCMPAQIFDRQMRFLKENGYHVITPDDLLDFLYYRRGLPRKSVMITVDDGYRSAYDIAYPILKNYGFKATMMIYTSFVGVSKQAITWDQLRKLRAEGFTIGSHTIFHSDLTNLRQGESQEAFVQRILQELHGSKRILDQKIGQDTYILAYPFGYYDQRVVEMARQAGYKMAVSVARGGNPFFANTLSLKRDQILARDMATFKSRLKTFEKLPLK